MTFNCDFPLCGFPCLVLHDCFKYIYLPATPTHLLPILFDLPVIFECPPGCMLGKARDPVMRLRMH